MNILLKTALIGLLTAIPLTAFGDPPPAPPQPATPAAATVAAPAYKPPLRGAPAGRIGGGTRGATERESFVLQVLAPDHIGYTIHDQPCLYWYISKATAYPLELTVTERNAVQPLVEKTLQGLPQGGIQSACLAGLNVKLRKDVQYKWFVTLVTDPEHRSKDILAGGIVSFIDPQPALVEKLKSAEKSSLPLVYAEEGLWYDALEALSTRIDASPDDRELRRQRAALLAQVGLAEVADAENNR